MIWGSAYLKETYKHEWDIANSVMKGDVPQQPKTMRKDIYLIILQCWIYIPRKKITIDDLKSKLIKLLN